MSKRKEKGRNTPLAKHQKIGTKLISPMGALNMTPVDWTRDLLPEHLWIGALAIAFGIDSFHNQYRKVVDALDEFVLGNEVNLGLVSDFGRVPAERRQEFVSRHGELIRELVSGVIGGWLHLYPDSPATWLLSADVSASHNPTEELAILRRLVVKLLPGKDAFAGRVRAIPLDRMFHHDRLKIPRGISVEKLLPKYPPYCTADERYQVESFARNTLNMTIGLRDDLRDRAWPKYFWRHNYDLAVCAPGRLEIDAGDDVAQDMADEIIRILDTNAKRARDYLDGLATRLKIDLYDPLPDEILFGLFGRLTRLYLLFVSTPQLWARDTSGIILRCLAETAITFSYLAKNGSRDEFEKFKNHGEGQEKLLMLHLQDNHPTAKSLEGLTSDQIAEQMGDFSAEVLDIELGHWSKKDTRKLAQEAGVEDLYRLVFNPTSGDVHGTWVSLKKSNLLTCAEMLHRFHRLPSFVEPPFFVQMVEAARELYERCVKVAILTKQYPSRLEPSLEIAGIRSKKRDEGNAQAAQPGVAADGAAPRR
jgi:hypothetical protein